ncbi:MAG TPA: FHA domain-containing protein [Thermoanaerobaculia bacterium]|nr:FHA domain-containing protein [Thermoanaerobaculia bacterium]
MLRLLSFYGQEERVFEVPDNEAQLGSSPENDLVLRVPGISRRHALVRRCPGGVELVDLGSKNGIFVEGRRVKRAFLTPGLRLQIGVTWLELEDVDSSQAELTRLLQDASERAAPPSVSTVTELAAGVQSLTPAEAALALAYHIAQRGVALPGRRTDLLARIKATLGAEAFLSFERRRSGGLRTLESEGTFLNADVHVFASLAADASVSPSKQVLLKRAGPILVAGRGPWFLGAKFAGEALAREGWRKDFLRFLAHRFFLPLRTLDDLNASEAQRILALVGGNKRKAAGLLGISPGTLYKLLGHRGSAGR